MNTKPLIGLALLWSSLATAETDLPMDDNWYVVEVLVFAQTDGNESSEALLTDASRAYRANLVAPAFADIANPGGGFAPMLAVAEPFPEAQPDADVGWFPDESIEPPEQGDGTTDGPVQGIEPVAIDELPAPALTPLQQVELEFAEALAAYQSSLESDVFRWRLAALSLTPDARAIERRGIGTVLVHGAWLQAVPDREAPQPVLIQSDTAIDDRWQIEGSFAVTRGRFLHVHAQLWYQPRLPEQRDRSFVNLAAGDGPVMAGIPFDLDDAVDPRLPYQLLSERRRMRSGELHYLDHPTIGVLVRIDPAEPPAELVALFEQLEEGIE